MKVFGKKTLALVLTIAMALSLCSFTAFAGGPIEVAVDGTQKLTISASNVTGTVTWSSGDASIASVDASGVVTGISAGTTTITANYTTTGENESPVPGTEQWTVTVPPVAVTGVTLDKENGSITVKGSVTLIATVEPTNATNRNVTWSSSNENVATVSNGVVTGVTPGEAIITVTTVDGTKTDTFNVTVTKATIASATGTATGSVPYGADLSVIKTKLPTSVEATLAGSNAEVSIPTSELEAWSGGTYNQSTKQYDFTTTLKAGNTKYEGTGVAITVSVPAAFKWPLSQITMSDLIDGDGDTVTGLDDEIEHAIEAALGVNVSGISFDFTSGYYGKVSNSTGTYTVELSPSEEEELYEKGKLVDTINYKATVGGVKYEGTIKLSLYTTDIYYNFGKDSGSMSAVASEINDRLGALYGSSYNLDDIIFDNLDLKGGDLFTDSDCTEEVYEDESYTASQLAKMYYVPNGSGEVTEIDYTAYVSSSRYISGTIYLYSDEFLVIQVEMNTGDTLQFSAKEFEEAFLNLKNSYESLKSVTFNSGVPNSKSAGYVYYDGETKIKSGTFFVEPSKTSEKAIDNLTYEAGTEGGVYSINFTAKGTDERNKSVTVTGIYQITVRKAADLTIEAGVKESVSFDLDMFEEFYQENISKNYKNYDIVAVSFSGVPNSKEKGYLRNDGKSIKSPNDKKFYIDSDKEGDYAFEDLTFEGGSKASTTRAEFTVYAKKDGKGTAKTVTGTIDFIVGSTHSLSGSIKASETMKFAASLSAFEDLGGNDNVYVTFTGLPTGGKLVYNWGTGSQEDVKVGTEYYLSYKAGKKLLSSVTFVPSYSSSKQARTISIPVKAYNSKEKAVTGTINITVNYAAYSVRFTDITTSTYADSVDFLYNQGITTGMTTTTFGPNSNVTRAQFVTFLYRAAGQPAVTGVTNKFTDVKSTGTYAYAYNAILWAVQNNITTGRSATRFDPAANVTHQELLTFLYRYDVNYLGHPGTQGSLSGFIDASSLQSYAVAPAKWASYKGIIDGYTLQPAVAGSRATVALWLHRMLTL